MKKNPCAVILGSYVNEYSIVRDLFENKITEIIVIDDSKGLTSYSKMIRKFIHLKDFSSENLLRTFQELHYTYDFLILYPCSDFHIEFLREIFDKISEFCFIPMNPKNVLNSMDKAVQYSFCEKLNIPYPKTVIINDIEDLSKIDTLVFPIIIKPNKRDDFKFKVFRNIHFATRDEYLKRKEDLISIVSNNVSLLASEIIPGDGSNIYAYIAYRNKEGIILNEWSGKKLSQYPNDFGVFASASNQAPMIITQQGKRLIEAMDLFGIIEPEFKYDFRDGKYKLMEINLRSMMWHRVGNLSGVNIQYTQYLDALGIIPKKQNQNKERDIHLVYFKHEIFNLLSRKGYLQIFVNNFLHSDETHFMVFSISDIMPFIIDLKNMIDPRELIRKWKAFRSM